MIRRYIPLDQRNKNRVWPCRGASGTTVMVACDKITFTTEDLSEWVRAGLLVDLGPVDEFGRTPDVLDKEKKAEKAAEKPPVPAYIKKDSMSQFADALGNAFAKPLPQTPVAEPVVTPPVEVAPVASTEDSSAVGNESFVAEPVVADAPAEVGDVLEDAPVGDAPAELTEETMADMTRAQLWEIIVSRSLQEGRSYRSVTKSEMIHIILGD